jgi:hypothetical protein
MLSQKLCGEKQRNVVEFPTVRKYWDDLNDEVEKGKITFRSYFPTQDVPSTTLCLSCLLKAYPLEALNTSLHAI